MPYKNFTDYPLWQEASALTDSIFDFSRAIEDFPLRNRMTGAAVEIPFLLGEAAQSESDEMMKELLWKVEDPVNELRSVLTEAKEHGFAPGADYELIQARCRDLFQKVHTEASSPVKIETVSTPAIVEESEDPELAPEITDKISDEIIPEEKEEPTAKKASSPSPAKAAPATPPQSDDDEFDENMVI
ncbi:MAG: hypothetical protein ACQKBT_00595 [Puniceicoccales bacterium]